MQPEGNVDAPEIEKFDALAHRWWDPNGDFKPLHDINPARLDYISQRTDLSAGPTVDIGCGGGILSESMASAGSATLGIDMAGKALGVAKLHALEAGVDIEYLETTAEQLAHNRAGE
ncbi:MAG TPA: 3-demethylubiquinone-9 3-O-methyltransferase, partial [Gammaproteobacteria bacterium]|nr:3-demethylubiquinone-9 3-O-methyltransferase [Gammaproteobacteria bacterium]